MSNCVALCCKMPATKCCDYNFLLQNDRSRSLCIRGAHSRDAIDELISVQAELSRKPWASNSVAQVEKSSPSRIPSWIDHSR